MKRNFKIFIILIVALALLAGCQKETTSTEGPRENTSNAIEANADNQKMKKVKIPRRLLLRIKRI